MSQVMHGCDWVSNLNFEMLFVEIKLRCYIFLEMGNAASRSKLHELSEFKVAHSLAEEYLEDSPLHDEDKMHFKRAFYHHRQKKLQQALLQMKPFDQIQLLEEVKKVNLEILDSLYEHLIKRLPTSDFKKSQNILSCRQPQISRSLRPVQESDINIVDLTKRSSLNAKYEHYKQQGLELIRSRKVCFIMLAGGANLRFLYSNLQKDSLFKELEPLPGLPSGSCLFVIFLKRLESLSRLVDTTTTLHIIFSSDEKEKKMKQVLQLGNFSRITVKFIKQVSYGALDLNGQVVFQYNSTNKQPNGFFLHPNGTGDIWNLFENYMKSSMDEQNSDIEELLNFDYCQIFGVSNSLQHVFDCYMIGKVACETRPWCAMAVKSKVEMNESGGTYICYNTEQNCIEFAESDEQIIYERSGDSVLKSDHLFSQNSVVSMSFINQVMNNQLQGWIQKRKFYGKVKKIKNPIGHNPEEIIVFQKKYTDLFKMKPKGLGGSLIIVEKQDHYQRLITRPDLITSTRAISRMHSQWLGLQIPKYPSIETQAEVPITENDRICEIDPSVSLEGENLQQVRASVKKIEVKFPLHVQLTPDEQTNEGEQWSIET